MGASGLLLKGSDPLVIESIGPSPLNFSGSAPGWYHLNDRPIRGKRVHGR